MDLSFTDRFSPDDFGRVVNAREYAWNLDVTQLEHAGLAAAAALLYGGELVVDNPREVLHRLRLKDAIIEPRSIWLLLWPPECSGPFPVALRPDTAIWVLHYLVLWASSCDPSPDSRPFAAINLRDVLHLAQQQLLRGQTISLEDLIAANRIYLRGIYSQETIDYLSGNWTDVKVACVAPPPGKRTMGPRSDRFQAVAAFRRANARLERDQWPDRQKSRAALRSAAERHLTQLGVPVTGGLPGLGVAIPHLAESLMSGQAHPADSVNELLALLMLRLLERGRMEPEHDSAHTRGRQRGLRGSSLARYASALRRWLLGSAEVPFWTDTRPLAYLRRGHAEVLLGLAHGLFSQYLAQWPALRPGRLASAARRPADSGQALPSKRVTYVTMSFRPALYWLRRIDATGWPLNERRSLQWQFLLAGRLRKEALEDIRIGDFFAPSTHHIEVVTPHEKHDHPGGRIIDPIDAPLLWKRLWRWLDDLWQSPEALLMEPVPGERYVLEQRLPALGFGRSLNAIRRLSATTEYLSGTPLVLIALKFFHEFPETTLTDYVAARHLRQRQVALAHPSVPLPTRVERLLTGFSRGAQASDGTGLPLMAGLRSLPFLCFRRLSIVADDAMDTASETDAAA